MPRPNMDRVMVSFYLARETQAQVERLAEASGRTKADTYRDLLTRAIANEQRRTNRTASMQPDRTSS